MPEMDLTSAANVTAQADKMASSADDMMDILGRLTNEVRALETKMETGSGREIVQKYESLSNRYQQFRQDITDCVEVIKANADEIANAEASNMGIVNQNLSE